MWYTVHIVQVVLSQSFQCIGGQSQHQNSAAATAQLQCKQVSTVICHLFGGCQADSGQHRAVNLRFDDLLVVFCHTFGA